MKYKIGFLVTLLCLVLFHLAVASTAPQNESNKPKSDAKKNDDKRTSRPDADSRISVHIKVSAQGIKTLPPGSTIQLKGNQDACKEPLDREQPIQAGDATFEDLPVCPVRLWIYITGFDSKTAQVDLANYRNSLQITVKATGPPVVKW